MEFSDKSQSFTIPANYFVYYVDFDCEKPYAIICNAASFEKEEKIYIPEALAYYLKTQYCGSKKMEETIASNTKDATIHDIREKTKALLKAIGMNPNL
jgi:hypothetical protein